MVKVAAVVEVRTALSLTAGTDSLSSAVLQVVSL